MGLAGVGFTVLADIAVAIYLYRRHFVRITR
jgi:hypothetical protein